MAVTDLPAHVTRVVRLDLHRALAALLADPIPPQLVAFVRLGREPHRADVVRPRIRGDRVCARLPDARREVEPRLCVWDPVPVEYELDGRRTIRHCKTWEDGGTWQIAEQASIHCWPIFCLISCARRQALL